MDVTIVSIVLGATALLISIVRVIYEVISNKNQQPTSSHFSSIYRDTEFKKIVDASNKAGKFNSPFIENDNIIDTIVSGGKILAQETIGAIDIFNEVGDFDERPNWQKIS